MLLGYNNPATASAPYPASLGWYSTAQCAASRYRSLLLPAPEYHLPVPANCHVNGTKFRCGMGDYWWLDSLAEWLACWTQAQKDLGSNRSRDAVG